MLSIILFVYSVLHVELILRKVRIQSEYCLGNILNRMSPVLIISFSCTLYILLMYIIHVKWVLNAALGFSNID